MDYFIQFIITISGAIIVALFVFFLNRWDKSKAEDKFMSFYSEITADSTHRIKSVAIEHLRVWLGSETELSMIDFLSEHNLQLEWAGYLDYNKNNELEKKHGLKSDQWILFFSGWVSFLASSSALVYLTYLLLHGTPKDLNYFNDAKHGFMLFITYIQLFAVFVTGWYLKKKSEDIADFLKQYKKIQELMSSKIDYSI